MSNANPKMPFRIIVLTIAQGTTVEALWISSLMWQAESAPRKEKTLVIKPMKNDKPSEDQPPPLINVAKTSLADP